MAMTVEKAAEILGCVYNKGKEREQAALRVHLFGIKYADELANLSIKEVATRAGIPGYAAEVNKGRNLAGYVVIKPGVDLCA